MADRDGPKCGGKRHGRAETCTLPAGWGTDHVGTGRCRKHFGNAPNVRQAAANEGAREQARRELARLGVDVEPITDPVFCLAELAGEARQWQQFCRERVRSLDPDDMRFIGTLRGEQQRAEISMYQQSVDQSGRLLIALSKAYTEDQQARIKQRQIEMMSEAMTRTLAEVPLSPEQVSAIRTTYARNLRAIAVGAPAEHHRALPATETADDGALVGRVVR